MPTRRVVAILADRNPATVVGAYVRLLADRLYTYHDSTPGNRGPVGSLP